MLPAFTLYGLVGCAHCSEAEMFLRRRNLSFGLVIADDDPIAAAGIKQLTGKEEYPVLLCRLTKEIIVGYKIEDYERLANIFYSVTSAGAPSVFDSPQQSVPAATEAPAATATASRAT